MKSLPSLPDGYTQILSVDLQKNKKLALLINGSALGIVALLVLAMQVFVPFDTFFDTSKGWGEFILRAGVLLVGIFAYMILHELIHGIAMKLCGTKKVKYGFTGLYAFAGSDDYYTKGAYIFIALAPVVLWGIILTVATILVPAPWFWVVYLIQVVNLSGATGDLYVTIKFATLPKDILVCDKGVGMQVFSKQNATLPPSAPLEEEINV